MIPVHDRWKIIACSIAGTSHLAAGIPCQDACAYRVSDDGSLIGAIADGAGSARFAAQGSSSAARSAVEFLESRLLNDRPKDAESCRSLMRDCIVQVRGILEKEAASLSAQSGDPVRLGDLATTLIAFCLAEPFLAVLQIGDGAMVFRRSGGTLLLGCKPEQYEYLNETCFLTSNDFEQHCQIAVEPSNNVDAISAFTDGLQMLAIAYRDQLPHGPFFNPLFNFFLRENAGIEDMREFLASDRVCERSDDDKTLMIAVRIPAKDKC